MRDGCLAVIRALGSPKCVLGILPDLDQDFNELGAGTKARGECCRMPEVSEDAIGPPVEGRHQRERQAATTQGQVRPPRGCRQDIRSIS